MAHDDASVIDGKLRVALMLGTLRMVPRLCLVLQVCAALRCLVMNGSCTNPNG
jgi:hypothetical protein